MGTDGPPAPLGTTISRKSAYGHNLKVELPTGCEASSSVAFARDSLVISRWLRRRKQRHSNPLKALR